MKYSDLDEVQRSCLWFFCHEPGQAIDCDDKRLKHWNGDGGGRDVLNELFPRGLLRQQYDTCRDVGHVEITDAGRRALEGGDG